MFLTASDLPISSADSLMPKEFREEPTAAAAATLPLRERNSFRVRFIDVAYVAPRAEKTYSAMAESWAPVPVRSQIEIWLLLLRAFFVPEVNSPSAITLSLGTSARCNSPKRLHCSYESHTTMSACSTTPGCSSCLPG